VFSAASEVYKRQLQKLLFSEEAHYPDTEKMTAKEIVDGTLRQVDIDSGWVFRESTANGYGNYFQLTWAAAVEGVSRFKARFYSWRRSYTEEQFALIASEFTDKAMLRQEYPETAEEAFVSSGTGFFDQERIHTLLKGAAEATKRFEVGIRCGCSNCEGIPKLCRFKEPVFSEAPEGPFHLWEPSLKGVSYTVGVDVAEGVEGDYSVARVIENGTARTVAKYRSNVVGPAEFARVLWAIGRRYNWAHIACESNKDGNWVNAELIEMGYPNLHQRESVDDITGKVSTKMGFATTTVTRPVVLAELRTAILEEDSGWVDPNLLRECLTFVRSSGTGRPEAMSGCHDDEVMAHAIALYCRGEASAAPITEDTVPIAQRRLDALNRLRRYDRDALSQDFYRRT